MTRQKMRKRQSGRGDEKRGRAKRRRGGRKRLRGGSRRLVRDTNTSETAIKLFTRAGMLVQALALQIEGQVIQGALL